MEAWVLIVYLGVYKTAAGFTADFNSELSCKIAAEHMAKALTSNKDEMSDFALPLNERQTWNKSIIMCVKK